MPKQKPQQKRAPKSKSSQAGASLRLRKTQGPTFTEIGGSPVPGLTLRQVLRGHTGAIHRIAWSPDGSYLASPSADHTIRIWDASSGKCVRTFRRHSDWVYSVAWSPDGQHIASASGDKKIRLWEAASGNQLQSLEGHTGWVFTVAWSPDGQSIASGSDDNTVRIWDPKKRLP